MPFCGDGITDDATEFGSEECDDGQDNAYEPNTCRPDCVEPICGDGILDDDFPYNEECDDGNTDNGDGCSSVCMLE